MSQRRSARRPTATAAAGPIKPGSPLHRALEMVAQAVAKKLDETGPAKDGRRAKAKPGTNQENLS